jgi:hypothetical protein
VERKLPFDFYAKAGYTWRQGERGFAFDTPSPQIGTDVLRRCGVSS